MKDESPVVLLFSSTTSIILKILSAFVPFTSERSSALDWKSDAVSSITEDKDSPHAADSSVPDR